MHPKMLACTLLCVVNVCALAAPDEAKPLSVLIELRDGSRIKAEMKADVTLQVDTRYGIFRAPLAEVRNVAFDEKGEADEVRAGGMVMVGVVDGILLDFRNEYLGIFSLGRDAIKRLRVAPGVGGLAGKWKGEARDVPGTGNSRDDMSLEISEGGQFDVFVVRVRGKFVDDDQRDIDNARIEDGRLTFEMEARDGKVSVALWPDPDNADKLKGEAKPIGEGADPRVIELERVEGEGGK